MPLRAALTHAAGAGLLVLLGALPAPARAQNVLPNGSFDSVIQPWTLIDYNVGDGSVGWSPVDVDESPSSGSMLLANELLNPTPFVWAQVCLAAHEGVTYEFGFRSLVPAGQDPSGDISSSIYFFEGSSCDGEYEIEYGPRKFDVGSWETSVVGPATAPAGTHSIQVVAGLRKTHGAPGAVIAHFDEAYLVVSGGGPEDPPPEPDPEPDPPPEPDPDGWFVDPAFPGFRFNVLITAGGSSRLGVPEPVCLPETVCVSGAVPGRVEVLLRIVGPKPNGYLWPTLFKASTSRFDVWIEQESTGTVKYYLLEGAGPGSSDLPGLFDREGFLP